MIDVNELRKGVTFELDGNLYKVLDYSHNKTGRGRANIKVKARNLLTGANVERSFSNGQTVQDVSLDFSNVQYLYKDGDSYIFMDNETFEQVAIAENVIDAPQFLRDGDAVSVLFNTETETPMSVELPEKVVVRVTYSEPGLRGDTATRTLKPATVETGATVMVPLFVNEGELIRVNTKSGEYVERVKE